MKSHWLFGGISGVWVSWFTCARARTRCERKKEKEKKYIYERNETTVISTIFRINRALAVKCVTAAKASCTQQTDSPAPTCRRVFDVWLNALHVSHNDKTAKVFLFIIRCFFFVSIYISRSIIVSFIVSLSLCVCVCWFTASSGFNE